MTQSGRLAWAAGGCCHAGPRVPSRLLAHPSLSHSHTHFFSLAAVAEELIDDAGGAGVIAGPACMGTYAQILWGIAVRGPGGEGRTLQAFQQLLPQAKWMPGGRRLCSWAALQLLGLPAKLPGQPWTTPQQVPTNQGCSSSTIRPPEEYMCHPPPGCGTDSPAPITFLSIHAHLCNCSKLSHMCGRPHTPVLHAPPGPIVTRAHMPTHSPHTCSRGQHADMTAQTSHTSNSVNLPCRLLSIWQHLPWVRNMYLPSSPWSVVRSAPLECGTHTLDTHMCAI